MSRIPIGVLFAVLAAPSALAQNIDDDPLMPPPEIREDRATILEEEDSAEEGEPPGPDPGEPKLADRCYAHELTVPQYEAEDQEKAYKALEKQVEKWIATCVASRTLGKDGKPLRRERKLVRNNASLKELFPLLEQGEKTTLEADYEFDGRRVVAIAFY